MRINVQQLSFQEGHTQRPLDAIVNVASVPQRSPFRYPGGKTWLVPRVRAWLASLQAYPKKFIEPFAGGGIIALTVAFERLAEHIIMVERDMQVAAVWRTVLGGGAKDLAQAITSFEMNEETLTAALERTAETAQEIAFQTILKNRTHRGGILAPGAGRIKYGENGKGILSRWYPATISRRILEIAEIRERITFIEGDGLEVARQYAAEPTAVFFIDPPYTASMKRAGSRLYLHSEIDHEELFRIASTFTGDFLMTYDAADELHALAALYEFDTELVAMKNTHHAEMAELLIGQDLSWAR
jgi:DNA adenine methylase